MIRPSKPPSSQVGEPLSRFHRWQLWTVPRGALALILTTELVAVCFTCLLNARHVPSSRELVRFALIFGLSAAFAELCDRVDRLRRFLGSDRAWVNATSVWAIAAVLTLPEGLAAAMTAAVYAHVYLRSRRDSSARPHRLLFTAATMVLATLVADAMVDATPRAHGASAAGPLVAVAVALAMLAFHIVNQGLVGLVVYLVARPPNWRSVLISGDDRLLEGATLVLGGLLAQAVVRSPWMTPGVLLVLPLVYRSALVRQLEVTATVDAKTGLLNSATWHSLARRAMGAARKPQSLAVLLIDIDNFKGINDTVGHLNGDHLLTVVGKCLKGAARPSDLVCRFGGDEFAVFLGDVDAHTAYRVAERFRIAVQELKVEPSLSVTATVGLASALVAPEDLDTLIRQADVALYLGKAAGGNQVVAQAADLARSATSGSPPE